MSEFKRRVAAALVMSALTAWFAGAQVAPPAGAPARTPRVQAPLPSIAIVGTMRIAQMEFDARAQQAAADYKGRTGGELPTEILPLVRRQILESLIRRDLLMNEAQRRGLLGTEQEAAAELQKDPFFQVNGHFDPARYEQTRMRNPVAFASTLHDLRVNLGARQLLQRIQAERGPSEAALRARATRALTRASADYLVLRRGEFSEDYPEPRESDVLDYYRAHASDFAQAARATLSAVFVDQPALSDSAAAIPAAAAAWTARMRQSADSILAAVAAGRTLEQASGAYGGPRPNQVVVPDNFPGYWQGGAATRTAVFAAAAGTVLPQPVAAQKGWLVVRVDEVQPAHTRPLREVAPEIRSRLRSERRLRGEDAALRGLYEELRDSLKVTAIRARYAVADTSALQPARPSAAEVDRYYRGHLADYSSFSSRVGGVVARSLDEVRPDVEARLRQEASLELSRALAARLQATWAGGHRDAALEQRLHVREVGPIAPGMPADTGLAGRLLGDSLRRHGATPGQGLFRSPRGWLAFDVYEVVPGYLPSFEQARPHLSRRLASRRAQADEDGARQLFARSPERFSGGPLIHYTRAFLRIPSVLNVHLTRAEVERYHNDHMDQFSAPELVRANHILISPRDATPEADHEAKARADSLLERLRAGEDFEELAAKVTDDPATKENGGDLGLFGRGTMLPEVERAAFAMRPGDLSAEPVKSSVGYHLIKAREYVPLVAQPLVQIYADVAEALARVKADSLAQARADSLILTLKDAQQGRAVAKRLGLTTIPYVHTTGERNQYPQELQPYYQKLETLAPGQVLHLRPKIGGLGYAVTWVDSISPPGPPTWENARDRAIEAYRGESGQRGLDAKRAELDSLMQGGWSFDSLGVLWGGLQNVKDHTAGQRIVGIGTATVVDTLVFGLAGRGGLEPGQLSDWIVLLAGITRLRTKEIHPPDASALATSVESERRAETERALVGYFEELKKRFPVQILDRKLRDVALPQPPPGR